MCPSAYMVSKYPSLNRVNSYVVQGTLKNISVTYSITVIVTPSFYVPCARLLDIIPCNRCHTKNYLIYSIAAIGTRRFQ